MALDGTYAGLKASIADFLNRTDLTAVIPDFIALFEAEANRELRVRQKIISATATVSSEFAELPEDFNGAITVTLPDNSDLDFVSPEGLADRKRWGGTTAQSGTPTCVAVVGSQFQFYPATTSALVVTLTYYQRFTPFSSGANWLSTDHIDLYLYGSLVHSAPYLQDDLRLPIWASLALKAINDLKSADKKESYGARLTPRNTSVV